MPLSRLLLSLCALLLALAVTSATAEAPVYGPGEVSVVFKVKPASITRADQIAYCESEGGVLVPMVTEAVYTAVVTEMDALGTTNSFSYMGGSSMLTWSECSSQTPSLECIWYWDQGRYAGADNAVAFYKGNRDSTALPGAEMIGTAVSNHWRVISDTVRCPCEGYHYYGALLRSDGGAPFWSDTDPSGYSYGSVSGWDTYIACAIEASTTSTTTTTTTTTTVPPTTTTTAEPSEESSGVNVPLVVGLSVAAAVVMIVVVAVIVSLVCCGGCSCLGDESGSASASNSPAGSRQESVLHRSPVKLRRSDRDNISSPSVHGDARGKEDSSNSYSARSFDDDAEASQNDEELAPLSNSQCMQTPLTANVATAPPPGAVNVPMQAPMACNGLQISEAPQPAGVHSPNTCDASRHRRSSRVTFVE